MGDGHLRAQNRELKRRLAELRNAKSCPPARVVKAAPQRSERDQGLVARVAAAEGEAARLAEELELARAGAAEEAAAARERAVLEADNDRLCQEVMALKASLDAARSVAAAGASRAPAHFVELDRLRRQLVVAADREAKLQLAHDRLERELAEAKRCQASLELRLARQSQPARDAL